MTSTADTPGNHAFEAYQAQGYFPQLDGVRALSVLVVISVHLHEKVWDWLGGQLGVPTFFVLSGYLITTLAVREERRRGTVAIAAFYVRRTLRIFPLFYLILGLYCALILVVGMNPEKRGPLLAALPWYAAYCQEIPFNYGAAGQFENVPYYQTWSLGVEEKFYLVWPVVAFVLWRGRRRVRLCGTLALLAGFGSCHLWVADPRLANCLHPYSNILVGCLLALILDDRWWFARLRPLSTPHASLALPALLVAAHFIIPRLSADSGDLGLRLGYSVLVAACLPGLLLGGGPLARALSFGPLVFVGKLSYGMYLVHLLCINAANRVIPPDPARQTIAPSSAASYLLACVISTAVAYGLAVLVERPLIRVGRRWSMALAGR